MNFLRFVVVALLLFVPFVLSQDCGVYTGQDGDKYNLSPLTRPDKTPWFATEAGTTYTFYWNFCKNLFGVPPELGWMSPTPTVLVDNSTYSATSVGYLKDYTISETLDGLEITYTNDVEKCKNATGHIVINRVTNIHVMCNPYSEGTDFLVTEPAGIKCTYNIRMKHYAGCKLR